MMYAMRNEVVSSTLVSMVAIRHREIELLSRQANGLAFLFGLIAGVLACSMWTGYYMCYIRVTSPSLLMEGASALAMFVSIFLPLLGLWRCMLLMALAPFKALRGRTCDLAASVDSVLVELMQAAQMLIASVLSIFATLITFMLSSQTPSRFALLVAGTEAVGSSGLPAVCATVLAGLACIWAVWRLSEVVLHHFRLPTHMAQSGGFWSEALVAEEMRAEEREKMTERSKTAEVCEARDGRSQVARPRPLWSILDRDASEELF